ncbi:hypothetical protein CLV30_106164 [Haloactinopolyspora alba]|uniref:Uncharacterized protein n=1 Tax=Haloactinopolyspora alba TaxID=648780 RepID=A0A2P8E3X0_9ACTN|nr:hypothetical protein [Haloactinopolyspora alba]PSL04159.1 hypothetical protein CLV30_106164 [Haloactinopolyspora alba]
MTELREKLAQVPARRKPLGKVEAILASLDDAERDLVTETLAGTDHTSESLAAILTESGHPISTSTIRSYRRDLRRKVP